MGILDEISAERGNQMVKGFTPEHDDHHDAGELAAAASCYAYAASLPERSRQRITGIYSYRNDEFLRDGWPWSTEWWKPTTRRRDLIKAAALIVAELEWIDRNGGS